MKPPRNPFDGLTARSEGGAQPHRTLSREELILALEPELRDYIESDPGGLRVVHPLGCWSIPTAGKVAEANCFFRVLTRLANDARSTQNWEMYLKLFHQPYCAAALASIQDALSDTEFSLAVGDVYLGAEHPSFDPVMRGLLESPRIDWISLMGHEDRRWYDRLPEEFVVYRGVRHPEHAMGYSWSLDFHTACWFARRGAGKRCVLRASCKRTDVMVVHVGGGECEVTVSPTRVANVQLVREVPRPGWLQNLWLERQRDFKLGADSLHGRWHWEKVEMNAAAIAAVVEGCDIEVVQAFAVLHDCHRENEDQDPAHGARAADLAERLYSDGRLPLSRVQLRKLITVCKDHAHGETSNDPTVGACFDADRLDLARVGTLPERRFFSTQAAFDLLFRV